MAKDMTQLRTRTTRAQEIRPAPRKPPAKVSERLEDDAQEMEARLHQLRADLQEEKRKLETERPAKYSGSRWRSASESRGSIRKYADEVQKASSKTKSKQSGDGRGSARSSKARHPERASAMSAVLSPASVETWTPVQVQQWLRSLDLDEFESAFEFHQVDGARLLSLSAEDCAGFGVAKLSVRNRLLVEVESLLNRVSAGQKSRTHREIVDPALREQPDIPSCQQAPGLKHWSQLMPLSEAKVETSAETTPVNLADGQFSEDDSHASFMKALLEWRTSDGDGAVGVEENQAGDWVNPMLCGGDSTTVADEPGRGGALLVGSYDEVQAHESFVQALEAWRRGGVEEARRLPTGECADSGCTTSDRKSCWQCYRIGNVDSLVADEQSDRLFCSPTCHTAFNAEHARLYNK